MWDETIASIPPNWHLCDGNAGTPDLREKFVRGALNQAAMGNTGGQDSQTHTFTGNGHQHQVLAPPSDVIQTGSGKDDFTTSVAETGTTDGSDNRPANYELAFIKRIA